MSLMNDMFYEILIESYAIILNISQ